MSQADMSGVAPAAWVHGAGVLPLLRPLVMGVLNVTPDSFYDGGLLARGDDVDVETAVARARAMVADGADIVDVGAESTRPGAQPIEPAQEIGRLEGLIEALLGPGFPVPISVDTRHAAVARWAVQRGVAIVNDVSGLADPEMADVLADGEAGVVIGHLRGTPQTMQRDIRFVDLLREVTDELAAAVDRAVAAGIERPRIVVDPGIGFGKSAEQSAALVAAAGWLRQATRCPVLIGASRKSFLGALGGDVHADRLPGSLAAALVAVERGASVLRVHDVAATSQALEVARSIRQAFEDRHRAAEEGGA